MITELTTYRLADGVSVEDFLAADERVQQEWAVFRPGFVRRTTSRSITHDGEWLTETLWADPASAEAPHGDDDALAALRACIDRATVEVRRYESLEWVKAGLT